MNRYVADTHAVLWFASGQARRLGTRARRAFGGLGTGATEIILSVVSLWEVALLHDAGALQLPSGFAAWCDALEACPGMRTEPLLRNDVEEARALAVLRDPHDRLIAGTALRLGLPLLTRDHRLSAHGRLQTIW